jgi:hypothetical protein
MVAAPGCAGLAPRTRLAYILINDPPVEAYRPVLDALVAAVLPCERAEFPVTAHDVGTRLLTIFDLETDPRFLAVQKMLLYFDETDLFPHRLPLMAGERVAMDARERGLDVTAILEQKEAADWRLHASFALEDDAGRRFTALPLERRREYLDLWNRSEFLMSREFYASIRALVMIAAYSMDPVWAAIGYDGPFVARSGT